MFRRKWSALPPDPAFPSDLKKLGYFINEKDEIRSIEHPNYYFKYFISRNERYNERQRFALNQAIEEEIHTRLTALGLRKILLPLGTTDPSQPHVPIFASSDMDKNTTPKPPSRVVLVFGETAQDLGAIAHRVIGGPGGINKGSMVSVVSALQQQRCSATDPRPPGIVLANTGQLLWWEPPPCHQLDHQDQKTQGEDRTQSRPEKQAARAMTRTAFDSAPMRSAVHEGALVTAGKNRHRIPGNGDLAEHVKYVFETVVPSGVVPAGAKLDIVAVGDAAEAVERYLDWGATWARWRDRIGCFANVGGYYPSWEIKCEGFRGFLREKARAYVPSLEPLGTILSGPDGNPRTSAFTELGCPVFSGGTDHFTEMLLVQGQGQAEILAFLQEVALEGDSYKNPIFHVAYHDVYEDEKEEFSKGWKDWQDQEDQLPVVEVLASAPKAAAADAPMTGDDDGDGDGDGGGGGGDEKLGQTSEDRIVEIVDFNSNDRDDDKGNDIENASTKGTQSDGKEDEGKQAKAENKKPESGAVSEAQAQTQTQIQVKTQDGGSKDDQQEQLETRLQELEI